MIPAREQSSSTPDLVVLNGRVTTLDPRRPEAEAVAVCDGVISSLGTTSEVRRLVGPKTEVLDLAGRRVVPGFVEGHGHLLALGHSLTVLNLGDAGDWPEITQRIGEAARSAPPGEWVQGRGWHQEKWLTGPGGEVEGYPVHHALSQAAPDNPVVLDHSSGHLLIANAAALARGAVTSETADPPGGRIVRDQDGQPTGVLIDAAMDLVLKPFERERGERTDAQVEADQCQAIRDATAHCLARGVTSFQDAGSMFDEVDRLQRLVLAGELGFRVWVMTWESNESLRQRLGDYQGIRGLGGNRLTFRAIKRLMDGALGARSAWLLDPYEDLPSTAGFPTLYFPYDDLVDDALDAPIAYVEETADLAIDHDFQLCTHAIGDRAVREVLDVYERVATRRDPGSDLRWRVEHASVIAETDVARFGQLGAIASMQAVSLPSDGLWMIDRLGADRARRRAFGFRALRRSGAIIANGTDVPVDPVDPLVGFHAMTTCELADGTSLWSDERLSREESLRACTIDVAYAAFEDRIKGSLEPGKLADMVVMGSDIMTVPETEIVGAAVDHTILDGHVVYSR